MSRGCGQAASVGNGVRFLSTRPRPGSRGAQAEAAEEGCWGRWWWGQGLRDSLTSVVACARQSEAELGPGRSKSEAEAATEDGDRVRKSPREAPVPVQRWEEQTISGCSWGVGASVTGITEYIGEGVV